MPDHLEAGERQQPRSIPEPGAEAGFAALQALVANRSFLAALRALADRLGEIFQIKLGRFDPVVLSRARANHFLLVEARDQLSWRPKGDPVTRLLGRGLLVTDDEEHDYLRSRLTPPLQKRRLAGYVPTMVEHTDAMLAQWPEQGEIEGGFALRSLTLVILMDTLFAVDVRADLNRLLPLVEAAVEFISPGPWAALPWAPRRDRSDELGKLDDYLFALIAQRRKSAGAGSDMLSRLVSDPSLTDEAVRDQLMTMLIAGHDTSTAHLAWTLHLLAEYPDHQAEVQRELDELLAGEPASYEALQQLRILPQVAAESLRLYPPIHIGNRVAKEDLEYDGYVIPAGRRVVYSIYATHRATEHWPEPDRFDPARFSAGEKRGRPAYAYVPFGGGPRNCIGMAFAQVQAQTVLSRILQRYSIAPAPGRVRMHMGATLEPAGGLPLRVRQRPGRRS